MTTTATLSRTDHAHHWMIDEVTAPTSMGRCRDCGAEKIFRNWPAEEVLQRAEYAA